MFGQHQGGLPPTHGGSGTNDNNARGRVGRGCAAVFDAVVVFMVALGELLLRMLSNGLGVMGAACALYVVEWVTILLGSCSGYCKAVH